MCCGRYHRGESAPDALTLMRSRYSAYALSLENYLLATWHADTRPAALGIATGSTKWTGLEVKNHTNESADSATVEFRARYKIGGRAGQLQETSRFIREAGVWIYVDGKITD
jgi:SEC-C motif-containing protein